MKIIKIVAITICSALLLSGYAIKAKAQNINKLTADTTLLKVGDSVPDIVFRDTTGHIGNGKKLSNLRGKYVVIDVWATWCYPCRAQQPHLVDLERKLKDKNITFVGISIDTQSWKWKGPYLAKLAGLQWMVKDKTFEKAFGITTVPRFILLDKMGKVLNLNLPMPSHPELAQQLNQLDGI